MDKETKETILVTIDEVFQKMNRISWIDRQKAMKDEAFKNTEKILYSYDVLKEHIKYEDEYLEMAFKGKSSSFVSYSKNKVEKQDEDTILKDRIASYQRSKSDLDRIEKALQRIKKKKGYEVIAMRYLSKKPDDTRWTYEEIADQLSKRDNYNDNLNEKTVRNYKNTLVKEMAVLLFGSDAI